MIISVLSPGKPKSGPGGDPKKFLPLKTLLGLTDHFKPLFMKFGEYHFLGLTKT